MNILIIGNGFDLDLGLKTQYSDFFHSKEFEHLEPFINHSNCLAHHLVEQQKREEWFDLEESMAEYVKEKERKKDFTCAEIDKFFLNELKYELWDYISGKVLKIPPGNSLAKSTIQFQNKCNFFERIYSFNCFEMSDYNFATSRELQNLYDVRYVHNCHNDIILGIGDNDSTSMQYKFLKKTYQNYPSDCITQMKSDMLKAENVVIFGHSFNRIDMVYFKDLFFYISQPHHINRNILLITKDSQSAKQIKENITDYAILFPILESSCNISFVYTEKCKSIKDLENYVSISNYKTDEIS